MKDFEVKTFIKALNCYPSDLDKMKSFLEDKRLSNTEKQILQCWINLSDNKLEDVIENLNRLITNNELVQSQIDLLMGLALNNKGESDKAKDYLIRSLEIIKEYPLKNEKLTCYSTLFIVYFNLKEKDGMKYWLDAFTAETSQKEGKLKLQKLCSFKYYSFVGDLKKSNELLDDLESMKNSMEMDFFASYMITKFNYYLKLDQLEKCNDVLEEMKKQRKFKLSANFKFMKAILDFLRFDTPLYLYDKHFSSIPMLHYQINVLKHLEAGDLVAARSEWQKLHQMSPSVYTPDMQYKGDKCLFSLGLEKLRLEDKKKIKVIKPIEGKTKEQNLIQILTEAEVPIKKEEIYELLWEEPPHDKCDFLKLAKMVCKINAKSDFQIKSRKGCYFMEFSAKQKKAS